SAALDSSLTVWEEMQSVFSELLEVQKKMQSLEQQLENHNDKILEEYDRLSAWFQMNDGYAIDLK
ncbi:MAG: hypothetical protein IKI37_01725, partial [Oscillospiraceae bacterium]|nr:hypothetical protein [Oscillospiraceae bacterium]